MNESERVYRISRWRGVNEAPEGEASLQMGEAAVMRNFRVTSGGALKKRPGSANVAGLVNAYSLSVDESTTETLLTETGVTTASFTMYPTAAADSVGAIVLSGEAVEVTAANAATYVGYYYRDEAGFVHRFAGIEVGTA